MPDHLTTAFIMHFMAGIRRKNLLQIMQHIIHSVLMFSCVHEKLIT